VSTADEVLETDVNLIVVGTRHDMHAELAAKALRKNKSVLVEKPLALTDSELDDVLEAAGNSSGRLMVGFNRRFSPLARQAKEFFNGRSTPLSIAYRVNAGENDIVIMPSTFGAGLDPSTRKRDRNIALFGSGKWNRVLIDATINLDYDPDPDFGGARFPPTVWPSPEDEKAARARWAELGLTGRKRD
jgi:predicted dehydrogenase